MTQLHRIDTRGAPRLERGLAMVEFVVGAPILFLFLLAICEFGNAFVQYSTLEDTVRNADRYLASNALLGSTGVVRLWPRLTRETRNLVVYGNTIGFGTPVLRGLAWWQVNIGVDAANNVSVSVDYPYHSIIGGRLPFFVTRRSLDTDSIVLTAYASMEAL